MAKDSAMDLPATIHTQDFGTGRLYVKFGPGLVSLLDSEWTPEELLAIATDIAQRTTPARHRHSTGSPTRGRPSVTNYTAPSPSIDQSHPPSTCAGGLAFNLTRLLGNTALATTIQKPTYQKMRLRFLLLAILALALTLGLTACQTQSDYADGDAHTEHGGCH